eukprot:scaffold107045_cov22-Tisochrysis_lutea.AAC.2
MHLALSPFTFKGSLPGALGMVPGKFGRHEDEHFSACMSLLIAECQLCFVSLNKPWWAWHCPVA